MVHVEQRALRALEQDAPARTALGVEQRPHVVHVWQHLRGDLHELAHQRILADLGHAQSAPQRIVVHEQTVDLGSQRAEVLEILGADGAPAGLVLVGRADAAPRGADPLLAGGRLAQLIELAMQRQDQRGVLGDLEVAGIDGDAALRQGVDLGHQMPRIEHHAVTDDAELAGTHDARGQQRQLVGLLADHQRVAGIVAALEAHDDVGALRQPVDDLALALVAPLGADHHHIRHLPSLRRRACPACAPRPAPGARYRPCRPFWIRSLATQGVILGLACTRTCSECPEDPAVSKRRSWRMAGWSGQARRDKLAINCQSWKTRLVDSRLARRAMMTEH